MQAHGISPLPNVVAIIVAGGLSQRMGFDKLSAPLAGRPLLAHTLCAFERCPEVSGIILVCDPLRKEEFHRLAREHGVEKLLGLVSGGKQRRDSVWNGILAAGEAADYLAVHDGARPLITPLLITNCIRVAIRQGAACLAEPLADTVHRADGEKTLTETVSREGIWRMQTPQVFRRNDLHQAYLRLIREDLPATDEASVFLRVGGRVVVEEATDWNFKITVPRDLMLAEAVLTCREREQE